MPSGVHRDAVGDRHRVEFHGRAAGGANALFHVSREVAQMVVARPISIHVFATPDEPASAGPASLKPTAFSMARAAAAPRLGAPVSGLDQSS